MFVLATFHFSKLIIVYSLQIAATQSKLFVQKEVLCQLLPKAETDLPSFKTPFLQLCLLHPLLGKVYALEDRSSQTENETLKYFDKSPWQG